MSPNISRSSSISSISTTSSKYSDMKKKFSCSFPSCGKSFSRSEHLHRHALNHKEGNNTCMRCSAHFRRRDLLDRHMARHKEKDDEAGGEGLGVLATRKRLWRDASGNIVNARRPSYTQETPKRRSISRVEKRGAPKAATGGLDRERKMTRGQAMMASLRSPVSSSLSMSRNGSLGGAAAVAGGSSSSTIVVDSGKYEYPDPEAPEKIEEDSWLEVGTLMSPPASGSSAHSHSSEACSPADELSDLDGLYEEASWHGIAPPESSRGSITPPEFAATNWGQPPSMPPTQQPQPFQTFMGAMAELPYDDIFKPEAGMYDWQHWNSQVLMSRCREEKYEPVGERKIEWGQSFPPQETGFRRTFGMGTC